MPAPIVMVHGAFCGGWVWDDFRQPFERAGHSVLALDLPGHQAGAPRGAVTGLGMRDYANAVAEACASQGEPPILIGHSMGGLVAQLAAAKVRVRGLILLAPSAPWGVHGVTVEEAVSAVSLYALGPYWSLAIDPDYASARLYSFDRAPKDQRRAIFARMVPESGRALWETLNWWLDPFASTLVSAQEPKRYIQRVYDVKYADVKELSNVILQDGLNVRFNEHFKTISLYGTAETIATAEELIKRFDM